MKQAFHHCFILLTLASIATSQNARGNLNHQNEQDRIRCLGVQCPSERPRCITENQVTRCVPLEPSRTVSSRNSNNNRLSRRPPGLGSSLRQRLASSAFELSEAEKIHQPQRFTQPQTREDAVRNSTSVTNPILNNVPSFCYAKFHRGNCRAYFPRYYYNQETGTCRRFVFGGCGGNRNNFKTERACKSVCVEPIVNSGFDVGLEAIQPIRQIPGKVPNRIPNNKANPPQGMFGFAKGAPPPQRAFCQENVERGPCFAIFPRFYYNKNTKQCQSFDYGGCGGNRNNFRSMASCKRNCDYVDFYTSRQSNGNNIPQGQTADVLPSEIDTVDILPSASTPEVITPKPNQRPDFCQLPKKVGPCRALIPRFFFNPESKRCEQFGFGGCQPNKNNFRSESECKRQCSPQKNIRGNVFSRRRNNNNEMNTMLTGQLRQFNPIDSAAFREYLINQQMNNDIAMIGPTASGFYVCAQPLDPGTCTREIRSYYFNARTRSCQAFIFHGCGGNQNRFPSLRACQDRCMGDNLRPASSP